MDKVLKILWKKLKADPKTTCAGVLCFAVWIIGKFGLNVTVSDQVQILAFAVLFLGLFSKDTQKIPPPGR